MRSLKAVLVVGIVLGLACGVQAVPTVFIVPLDGNQEVPTGDPDGTGLAILTFDPDTFTVEWDITAQNIDLPLTGAHIHEAPAGVNGGVVVNFFAQFSGNTAIDPTLFGDILADPANYYVNLHNSFFPAGAIRGQLSPIPIPSAIGLAALGLASLRLVRRRQA